MSRRPITNLRPPTYVSRETGAAELDFSVDTWDEMVAAGKLPPPKKTGIAGTTPRWKWKEVEAAVDGRPREAEQPKRKSFFRGVTNGQDKERQRGAP